MRLLHSTNLVLEEFTGSDTPPYAILSHRWGRQEITFEDIRAGKSLKNLFATQKRTKSEGWFKINGCCKQAKLDGYDWVWVDSCCIDKSSSSELSEAINSMFNWYRQAQVCYAYLSDVETTLEGAVAEQFRHSKWFTRGWTLQELLAPKKLVFFNQSWDDLGEKKKLWWWIVEATGIKDEASWEMASVAQKMSWASKRETTRVEDRAYSLMGLFGVNMPPLYGEGEKAFIRLQLEILRTSDDESIFAWRDPNNLSSGLLAHSPDAFQLSNNITRFESLYDDKPPYSMTNKGLRMELPLLQASHSEMCSHDADDVYLAPIQCKFGNSNSMLALLLRCIKGQHFRRIACGDLISIPGSDIQTLGRIEQDSSLKTTIQVKQEDNSEQSYQGSHQYKFSVASNVLSLKGFEVTGRYISRGDNKGINWSTFADEVCWVDRVIGEENVVVALEFTESASGEDDDDDDSASFAALYEEQGERFIVVFNIYGTRVRLGIILPEGKTTMKDLLDNSMEGIAGDWMSGNPHLFRPKKLSRGMGIIAQLIRNQNDLDLRSYEAEISFEGAVELHGESLQRTRDHEPQPVQSAPDFLPELPNNEVTFWTRPRMTDVPISGDPKINYYIRSFLRYQKLEARRESLREFFYPGTIFYKVLPPVQVAELPNNEVKSLSQVKVLLDPPNPKFADPNFNYYIRSFLEYKMYEAEMKVRKW
jgi:hypothetical protein